MRYIPRTPILEPHVRAAWQAQVAAAVQTPGLLPELVRRHELLPRFAAYYTPLQTLPRRVRRALQRQWRLPLTSIALILALGQQPGQAATIEVDGLCTLIDAITAANTDTATVGCPAGSGADTIVLPAGSIQTLTSVNNETYGPTGLPVIRSVITIAGQGSTIARDSAAPDFFRILAESNMGELMLQETTVSGGVAPVDDVSGGVTYRSGGGVANYGGSVTLTHSTISGNTAGAFGGGGVANYGGSVTLTHSTISGNSARFLGGGVANSGSVTQTHSTISGNTANQGGGVYNGYGGTLTQTHSTISGNTAAYGGGVAIRYGGTLTQTHSTISGNTAASAGGGIYNFDTLILARTLVSGNTAPIGPEIYNVVSLGTVTADNHNLFGVNGDAGVVGFTPGATDIVPPASVQLPDILDPTLAFHGGFTQTHALVPGSPAIDAGGTDCTDATGEPLLTDQRGRPRVVDGDGDSTAACDIGAFEFFPIVNDFVTLDPALETAFDPTPTPEAPAGTFTITATFTNTSATPLRVPFFTVTELSGDNLLLNADEGTQGVGATRTPAVGDGVLAPGETVTVDFVIGLQVQERFTFFVDLFGEPQR